MRGLKPALIIILVLLAGLGYFFKDYFQPQGMALPLSDCDLSQQACRYDLPDGHWLEFNILPRGIPLLTPLQLQLKTDLNLKQVEVDFAGVDMNMGYNRVPLKKQNGIWQGKAFLPSCIRQRMFWRASLILNASAGKWIIPFQFETIQ